MRQHMDEIFSPFRVLRIAFQRHYYQYGYLYRREIVDDSEYGGDGQLPMVCCYSLDTGHWIGDAKMARYLCRKRGIRAIQKREPSHCVASIGFQAEEQQWYGWSHRAIYAFGIGSTVNKGDCGYRPATVDELYESITMPDDDGWAWMTPDAVAKIDGGVRLRHDMVKYTAEDQDTGELLNPIPAAPDYQIIHVGKGEWTAHTLDEAKQMACDFAESVS